jgi:hypothetical protein
MLLRRFPIPSGVSAALTVEYLERAIGCPREVCIRYQGRDGARYAFEVESRRPFTWDTLAHAELSWYASQRLFELMVARGLTRPDRVPPEYQSQEPPGGSTAAAPTPESVRPDGKATDRTDRPGASPLILGTVRSPQGAGLAVRLSSSASPTIEVAVYRPDWSARLGTLSTLVAGAPTPLGGDEFYVDMAFDENDILAGALFSDLFEVTGGVGPQQADGRRPAIWRIKASVLRHAVPVSGAHQPAFGSSG